MVALWSPLRYASIMMDTLGHCWLLLSLSSNAVTIFRKLLRNHWDHFLWTTWRVSGNTDEIYRFDSISKYDVTGPTPRHSLCLTACLKRGASADIVHLRISHGAPFASSNHVRYWPDPTNPFRIASSLSISSSTAPTTFSILAVRASHHLLYWTRAGCIHRTLTVAQNNRLPTHR